MLRKNLIVKKTMTYFWSLGKHEQTEVDNDTQNLESNLIADKEEKEPQNETSINLEKCSTIYYVGYLAKKCLDKFQCKQCQIFLLKSSEDLDDKDQLLIVNKTFENIDLNAYFCLKAPSENLVQFVTICLNVFKLNYNLLKSEKYLVNKLMSRANHSIPKTVVQPECAKHFEYTMKLIYRKNIQRM